MCITKVCGVCTSGQINTGKQGSGVTLGPTSVNTFSLLIYIVLYLTLLRHGVFALKTCPFGIHCVFLSSTVVMHHCWCNKGLIKELACIGMDLSNSMSSIGTRDRIGSQCPLLVLQED